MKLQSPYLRKKNVKSFQSYNIKSIQLTNHYSLHTEPLGHQGCKASHTCNTCHNISSNNKPEELKQNNKKLNQQLSNSEDSC